MTWFLYPDPLKNPTQARAVHTRYHILSPAGPPGLASVIWRRGEDNLQTGQRKGQSYSRLLGALGKAGSPGTPQSSCRTETAYELEAGSKNLKYKTLKENRTK